MSENYLYRSALPDQDESDTGTGCRFPLKKLIPLVRATGDYSLLDFIEHSLGRIAIPVPSVPIELPDVYRLTMQAVAEFGYLMSEIDGAVADGKITNIEIDHILKEGYHAIQAIAALLEGLKREEK